MIDIEERINVYEDDDRQGPFILLLDGLGRRARSRGDVRIPDDSSGYISRGSRILRRQLM
jgi:hypothetical protein